MRTTAWTTGAAAIALTAAFAGPAAHAGQPHARHYGAPSPYVQQVRPQPPARVWVPGHWEHQGHRQAWVNGHYRYQYVQPAHGHRHARRGGGDLDRDGIRDRFDRDRDGDGVPNRYDDRPDNPWRR